MTHIILFNPKNPNGIAVERTAKEIAQREIDISNAETQRLTIETEVNLKIQAQASGNAKLLSLGLSQEEATALTGYKPPKLNNNSDE